MLGLIPGPGSEIGSKLRSAYLNYSWGTVGGAVLQLTVLLHVHTYAPSDHLGMWTWPIAELTVQKGSSSAHTSGGKNSTAPEEHISHSRMLAATWPITVCPPAVWRPQQALAGFLLDRLRRAVDAEAAAAVGHERSKEEGKACTQDGRRRGTEARVGAPNADAGQHGPQLIMRRHSVPHGGCSAGQKPKHSCTVPAVLPRFRARLARTPTPAHTHLPPAAAACAAWRRGGSGR